MFRIARLRVLALVVASTGCGANLATSPSPTANNTLSLTPGEYVFIAGGSSIPPACGTLADVAINARITVMRDGADWIARPTIAADGDFELRFHPNGSPVISGFTPVDGTIRGTIRNKDAATAPVQVAATFDQNGKTVAFTGFANDTGTSLLAPTSQVTSTLSRATATTVMTCTLAYNWAIPR